MNAPHDIGLFGIKIRIKTPKFLKSALKVAGQGVSTVAGAAKSVGDTIAKVPVVGTPLHAVYDMGTGMPFRVADQVVKGQRIDKVAYDAFKSHVKASQTLAPYAQMVVSSVPGVGTGAAGIIGAANALSKGQPISSAISQGIRGALPGGPMAQAAFDVGLDVMSGKPVTQAALNAIPLPPLQKTALLTAANAVKDIANGKRVDEALVNRTLEGLPAALKQGVQVGLSTGQAMHLQQLAAKGSGVGKLVQEGEKAVKANPIFSAGPKSMGFKLGVGVLGHKATPAGVIGVRAKLSPGERAGFDAALAARVGAAKVKRLPVKGARAQLGYLAAVGAKDADPKTKQEIFKALSKDPEARAGFKKGAMTWWQKVVEWLKS